MRPLFATLAFVSLSGMSLAVRAAEPTPEKPKPAATLVELDKRISKALTDAKIPGASVTIIENGQIALTKGYGFADVKTKTPVTPDTVFRAGSISKSITSVAVMLAPLVHRFLHKFHFDLESSNDDPPEKP